MACSVHQGRLHCTVTDHSFGPQCDDDVEADALLCHIWNTRDKDPRELEHADLAAALVELRLATPYRIECGYGGLKSQRFAMWDEALERALNIRSAHASDPRYFVRVYNDALATIDSYGLTAEQQAELDAPPLTELQRSLL